LFLAILLVGCSVLVIQLVDYSVLAIQLVVGYSVGRWLFCWSAILLVVQWESSKTGRGSHGDWEQNSEKKDQSP